MQHAARCVMSKMPDTQSICIATAATNQVGQEGSIFRFVFWHSVVLASIVGVIVMLYAYVFPQFIPTASLSSTNTSSRHQRIPHGIFALTSAYTPGIKSKNGG
jgi:hypothetical protein